ncbi:MAG TPA: hypothetical protein P5511_09985, partial [Candidatus Goldiibacteriota bacterium]|nr:hypothetical protein [Candidatus Goldiibacteriota bacterium]
NLRELIERLHKVSEGEIREMEEKKKQIEEAVAAADTKIRELRYLIERNQLARKAEYKTAISIPPVQEELIPGIIKKTGQADAPAKQISTGKFSIIDSQQLKHHDSAETENSEKANMTPKNRFDHIKMLVKNGMAIEDIAKVTGLSRGEIELIRNLKK